MNVHALSKRYATALFAFAKEHGQIETLEGELRDLRELLETDRSLITFLDSPDVLDSNKEKLVRDVFGPRVSKTLVNFLLLLFTRKRIHLIEDICEQFETLALHARGVRRARVITAFRLEENMKNAFKSALESVTGNSILLKDEVDPSIIGGAVVIVHNKVIDDSVRTKLAKLRESLSGLRVY